MASYAQSESQSPRGNINMNMSQRGVSNISGTATTSLRSPRRGSRPAPTSPRNRNTGSRPPPTPTSPRNRNTKNTNMKATVLKIL